MLFPHVPIFSQGLRNLEFKNSRKFGYFMVIHEIIMTDYLKKGHPVKRKLRKQDY